MFVKAWRWRQIFYIIKTLHCRVTRWNVAASPSTNHLLLSNSWIQECIPRRPTLATAGKPLVAPSSSTNYLVFFYIFVLEKHHLLFSVQRFIFYSGWPDGWSYYWKKVSYSLHVESYWCIPTFQKFNIWYIQYMLKNYIFFVVFIFTCSCTFL